MEKFLTPLVEDPNYRDALGLPPQRTEDYTVLAQGEYNKNYEFTHPVSGKELLLRVNFGSQMHLNDQIGYEAGALRQLEPSGRTPKVYYVDGSLQKLDRGVLVMEKLPGRPLNYEREEELKEAARILADIHCTPVAHPEELLAPENSLKAILEECEAMVKVYLDSSNGLPETKKTLRELLDLAWTKVDDLSGMPFPRVIINTELNNTNFLIPEKGPGYLIDWEKPLYGDPAQDFGHFLAPTTTFWKTDVILDDSQVETVLATYEDAVSKKPEGKRISLAGFRERVRVFTQVTCLRGVTWCAMAWVEYQSPDRALSNESTRKKLDQYLDPAFLQSIRERLTETS